MDIKDSFNEKLERVFGKFSKYHTKILPGDFNAIVRKKTFSNRQLRMRVYTKLVTMMDLE
jgi:hypothetical protein